MTRVGRLIRRGSILANMGVDKAEERKCFIRLRDLASLIRLRLRALHTSSSLQLAERCDP